MKELAEQEINTVDMVVCNLYPFIGNRLKTGASVEHIIEQIDIGGPAMPGADKTGDGLQSYAIL